jgi:hypothetical protein
VGAVVCFFRSKTAASETGPSSAYDSKVKKTWSFTSVHPVLMHVTMLGQGTVLPFLLTIAVKHIIHLFYLHQ